MRQFFRKVTKDVLRTVGYELRRVPSINDPVLICQKNALRDSEVGVIVDVGGSYGETVELYRQTWPTATIHAFEPHPQICRKLTERFREFSNVNVNCRALGDVAGLVDLKLSSSQSMHSIVGLVEDASPYVPQDVDYSESVEVPVSTLDDFVSGRRIDRIDILKIDVEGYEKHVLIGGKRSLEFGIIQVICIEVMFVEHFNDQWKFQEINEFLYGNNYALFDIPLIKKADNGGARWGNAIYVGSHAA